MSDEINDSVFSFLKNEFEPEEQQYQDLLFDDDVSETARARGGRIQETALSPSSYNGSPLTAGTSQRALNGEVGSYQSSNGQSFQGSSVGSLPSAGFALDSSHAPNGSTGNPMPTPTVASTTNPGRSFHTLESVPSQNGFPHGCSPGHKGPVGLTGSPMPTTIIASTRPGVRFQPSEGSSSPNRTFESSGRRPLPTTSTVTTEPTGPSQPASRNVLNGLQAKIQDKTPIPEESTQDTRPRGGGPMRASARNTSMDVDDAEAARRERRKEMGRKHAAKTRERQKMKMQDLEQKTSELKAIQEIYKKCISVLYRDRYGTYPNFTLHKMKWFPTADGRNEPLLLDCLLPTTDPQFLNELGNNPGPGLLNDLSSPSQGLQQPVVSASRGKDKQTKVINDSNSSSSKNSANVVSKQENVNPQPGTFQSTHAQFPSTSFSSRNVDFTKLLSFPDHVQFLSNSMGHGLAFRQGNADTSMDECKPAIVKSEAVTSCTYSVADPQSTVRQSSTASQTPQQHHNGMATSTAMSADFQRVASNNGTIYSFNIPATVVEQMLGQQFHAINVEDYDETAGPPQLNLTSMDFKMEEDSNGPSGME